jgi:RNA polymerase sigma-70 factor (ECF subfamily)
VPSGGESPEERSLQGELAEQIQKAILTLPDAQRAVIVLIDVQGFSYEETALATGASIGTIKSRLSRARAKLRDLLSQHMELLPEEFRQ